MPSFEYEAVTSDGQAVKSVAFGRDLQEVMLSLTQRGMQVSRIENAYAKTDSLHGVQVSPLQSEPEVDPALKQEARRPETVAPPGASERVKAPPLEKRSPILTNLLGPMINRVPWKDLSFFFRQLGTLIEAGVPMVQTLDTLANQSRDFRLKKVVTEMRQAAEVGMPFSVVMQRYPEMFSPLVISLIRAGEQGGFLAPACKEVSAYLDQEMEIRNMYRRETFLPKVYLVVSMLIIGFTNVILASIGSANNLKAPLNDIHTWYWLGPLIIGIFLFFRIGLSYYSIRTAWHAVILKVPYIGKTLHHFAMAKFGRGFGALQRGGVGVSQSIYLAADATGNEYLRSRIYTAVPRLEEGAGIHETLVETGAFSPIVLNMIATGETTGSLDQMLTKVAEFYEEEAKVRARQTANMTGVAVGLAVAVYIGYVVISFWSGYRQQMGNQLDNAGNTDSP
jgi:type II secretory pathway component PulF